MRKKQPNKPDPKIKPVVPKANFMVNLIGGIWNTLGKAKRWVVQNPKKSLTAFLLVTGAGVMKLMNQNNASTSVAVNSDGQPLQAIPQPVCPS